MKITQNYFDQYLKKNYLFENNPKVAIALSGGPDSMCLLFLLNVWIKKKKGSLTAIIIDHQLRIESHSESKYIKEYLDNKKISSKIIKISNKNIKKKTMAEARKNRFNCLINYCNKNKILNLFFGHHFDDNLETFLIRKIAGSNIDGLSCIKNKITKNNLRILRPLLDINKKSILIYNKKNNISFILDPSNTNLNYTRALIRDFLNKEISHKKNIKNDFKKIKKYYSSYKEMIFQSLHKSIIKLTNQSIIIDKVFFLKQDDLIQSKIIEIVYRYLKFTKGPLRSKKIALSLNKLKYLNVSRLNLAGLIIKNENLIIKFLS